ncbi:MAG: hypothetical protein NTNFB01_38410 [Nitrospira sp.]
MGEDKEMSSACARDSHTMEPAAAPSNTVATKNRPAPCFQTEPTDFPGILFRASPLPAETH